MSFFKRAFGAKLQTPMPLRPPPLLLLLPPLKEDAEEASVADAAWRLAASRPAGGSPEKVAGLKDEARANDDAAAEGVGAAMGARGPSDSAVLNDDEAEEDSAAAVDAAAATAVAAMATGGGWIVRAKSACHDAKRPFKMAPEKAVLLLWRRRCAQTRPFSSCQASNTDFDEQQSAKRSPSAQNSTTSSIAGVGKSTRVSR